MHEVTVKAIKAILNAIDETKIRIFRHRTSEERKYFDFTVWKSKK